MKADRPSFQSTPLADGLRWPVDGAYRFEEKLDGRWHQRQVGGAVLVGELMRNGAFYAFDILEQDGQDLRALPLRERLIALDALPVLRPAAGAGGAFLASVLARGGEGVVAKQLDAPWGWTWYKCKRCEVFYCRIIELDPWTGGAVVADRETGERRGRMALRSKSNQVRVGSVLKVEAYGLTARGLLREARLDKDTPTSWLAAY